MITTAVQNDRTTQRGLRTRVSLNCDLADITKLRVDRTPVRTAARTVRAEEKNKARATTDTDPPLSRVGYELSARAFNNGTASLTRGRFRCPCPFAPALECRIHVDQHSART